MALSHEHSIFFIMRRWRAGRSLGPEYLCFGALLGHNDDDGDGLEMIFP